ncbi:MAG TPA: ATP-binding protein [Polyangiaceae bacterium]|nr:ATP-binding protein [Polyangiaceae bacterium]
MNAALSTAPALEALPTFEDVPEGMLVVDRTGRVRYANAAFLLLVSRPVEQVVGQPLEAIVAEEDVLRVVGFQTVLGAAPIQDGHMIFNGPNESRRPLVISSGFSRDQRFVVVVARLPGILHRELADASRWVVEEQERALSLTEARDALSAKNAALLTAQSALEQAFAQLKEEVAIRQKLERELGAARKLEALGQLSAGVAHEINTPLQYVGDSVYFLGQAIAKITSYLQGIDALLERQPAPTWPEAQAAIATARRQARLPFLLEEAPKAVGASKEGISQVSQIVQALKAFSHQDVEQKAPADVNAALRTALVMARHEYKTIATVHESLGELPPVECQITQLNQVFLNLIVNAAHAIADAHRAAPGTISVSSRVSEGYAEIAIADDGCGIPEAIQHKIFEPFFTTKEVGRGTGQGLALARQIVVDRHGGTLDFESEVGKGTTFRIRIPASARSEALS